eukprot:s1381_g24.t1
MRESSRRRNTFGGPGFPGIVFAWQAQHFGEILFQISWQAQHFVGVFTCSFQTLPWHGCAEVAQAAKTVAGAAFSLLITFARSSIVICNSSCADVMRLSSQFHGENHVQGAIQISWQAQHFVGVFTCSFQTLPWHGCAEVAQAAKTVAGLAVLQECQARVSHKTVQQVSHKSVKQECPARVLHKNVQQKCPTRVLSKSVPPKCPARVFSKSAPQECPERVFNKSVLQESPTTVSCKSALQEYPTRVSVLQECPARVPHKSGLKECPSRVSYKSVLQECPSRVSYKSVLQECRGL